jgi:hypothetical protein
MVRDKRQKFVELAEQRVNRALHYMRLIENLANRKNYEFSDHDAAKILAALEDGYRSVKASFREDSSASKNSFRLK